MHDKEKKYEVQDDTIPELLDEMDDMDVEVLLPTMNVTHDLTPPEKPDCIIKDDQLIGLYDEILNMGRKDRVQIDEVLTNFLDMVLNDGDSSQASKEAVVNLIKAKTDIADKMSKVADLMTRIKLKDSNTFPRYLAAQQNNKVVIEGSKRDLLKSINKIANNKKGENR